MAKNKALRKAAMKEGLGSVLSKGFKSTKGFIKKNPLKATAVGAGTGGVLLGRMSKKGAPQG
jgi:hypothetical protein